MNIEPSQKLIKTQLRKELRNRRGNLEQASRQRWDQQINQVLLERTELSGQGVVAAYLSFDGEPDLAPALAGLSARGVVLALPVIMDLPGKSAIAFHEWKPGMPLKSNRYGISEPDGTRLVPVPRIDTVLIPLVGWDPAGGRLGMGASFYDRLFQPFADQDKPARIGVAYDMQKVDAVPCEPWDVRLHGLVNENGWFTFES